jgi:hypothetical protein
MEQTIMRKSKPITRNWPSPDELATVDHGIRELVATLEPMQAERIRQHRERLRPRIQRIMEAIFRARARRRLSGSSRDTSGARTGRTS